MNCNHRCLGHKHLIIQPFPSVAQPWSQSLYLHHWLCCCSNCLSPPATLHKHMVTQRAFTQPSHRQGQWIMNITQYNIISWPVGKTVGFFGLSSTTARRQQRHFTLWCLHLKYFTYVLSWANIRSGPGAALQNKIRGSTLGFHCQKAG